MRRVAVFFYGLFMDVDLLRAKGVEPANVRKASVRGYALRIGNRATLLPRDGEITHGMLMELTHAEIDKLYADPSVNMYRAEAVIADGVAALCFNLIDEPRADEYNDAYAQKLSELKRRLGLP